MELFLLVDIINRINRLPNGDLEIGEVTTLDVTDDATASITGEFPTQYLNIGIPRGGMIGPAGGILSGTYPNPGFAVDMATQQELQDHLDDTTAHDASSIVFAPNGNLAATDVQAAVQEVRDESVQDGDAAGGVLSGTYPNPGFAVDMATQAELDAAIALQVPLTQKGAANGVATLDAGSKIPVNQLPSSVFTYEGTWNATTNTPTLAAGVGDSGQVYKVTVAGTQNLGDGAVAFAVNDLVIYDGAVWKKSDSNDDVLSVNGATGVVVLTAANIGSTATGDVAATNVQSAIAELASEKVPTSRTINGYDLSANRALVASDIGSSATGDVSATTVQAAIAELASEKASLTSPALVTPTRTTSPASGDDSLAIPTTAWVQDELAVIGAADALIDYIVLESTDSPFSFTKASYPAGKSVVVRVQAGGGAGGGAPSTAAGETSMASGGGAGGFSEGRIPFASLGASETCTIGGGGTGVSGAAGNNGSNSSFGAHLTATGGTGGGIGAASASTGSVGGGAGGAAGGSVTEKVAITGQNGEGTIKVTTTRLLIGRGGASPLGSGGAPSVDANGGSAVGRGYGGGGGGSNNGASQAARTGGAGAPGCIIIEVYG